MTIFDFLEFLKFLIFFEIFDFFDIFAIFCNFLQFFAILCVLDEWTYCGNPFGKFPLLLLPHCHPLLCFAPSRPALSFYSNRSKMSSSRRSGRARKKSRRVLEVPTSQFRYCFSYGMVWFTGGGGGRLYMLVVWLLSPQFV